MTSILEKLGMSGPTRAEEQLPNGNTRVTVTPPEWSGFSPSTIELTPNQFRRYQIWRAGLKMIQEALPELTADQREILMTGIGPREWDAAFKDDEDEPCPDCSGTGGLYASGGGVEIDEPCKTCGGSGKVGDDRK